MEPNVLIAIIVAIPPSLLAGAGIVIAHINNRRATDKINHVTKLTNSTLSKAYERIAELESELEKLHQQLDS